MNDTKIFQEGVLQMTKEKLKLLLKTQGDFFIDDSCYKLQFEIIKRIMYSKAIPDHTKLLLLKQYIGNKTTNNCVINSLKEFNKQ